MAAPHSLDTLSHNQLFDHIHTVIKRERLYLDPTLDRQAIIDYFHLPKERVGQAFTQGSDYNSLPDFIRNCRLEHACELLTSHPEMSINDVMTASGFSNLSVFSRNFKNKYDLTPSAYRREQLRQ